MVYVFCGREGVIIWYLERSISSRFLLFLFLIGFIVMVLGYEDVFEFVVGLVYVKFCVVGEDGR